MLGATPDLGRVADAAGGGTVGLDTRVGLLVVMGAPRPNEAKDLGSGFSSFGRLTGPGALIENISTFSCGLPTSDPGDGLDGRSADLRGGESNLDGGRGVVERGKSAFGAELVAVRVELDRCIPGAAALLVVGLDRVFARTMDVPGALGNSI